MEKAQRIKEIIAAEVPLREDYEAKRTRRKEVRAEIERLLAEEVALIHGIHAVSDQLEALRVEKRDLDRPPRQLSRQRQRS